MAFTRQPPHGGGPSFATSSSTAAADSSMLPSLQDVNLNDDEVNAMTVSGSSANFLPPDILNQNDMKSLALHPDGSRASVEYVDI